MKNHLGNLADPFSAVSPLDLADVSLETIQHYYRSCLTIRFAEETLARARQLGEIGGPVHLGIGQEAVSVGVASVLKSAAPTLAGGFQDALGGNFIRGC